MDTQLVGDPTDRALGPRRIRQRLQRHPRGPLAQLIGVPLLSHDSDPSVSSLPPSNPGRFTAHLGGTTPLTIKVAYSASYTATDGNTGTLPAITTTSTINLPVAEVQTLTTNTKNPRQN